MIAFYPQAIASAESERAPGCDVPAGYDCATPGFETPLTLDQALALSKRATVVYLYGKGLQDARLAADVMSRDEGGRAVPTVAVPGLEVPDNAFYVVVLGRMVKHKSSGEPVEFYQRYLNRGEVFGLTVAMYDRMQAQK